MGGSEPPDEIVRHVAAKKFHAEAEDRVEQRVAPRDLTGIALEALHEYEGQCEIEQPEGFVELRRMTRDPGDGRRRIRRDRPRRVADASVAAAVHEATDAAKDLAQREARRERVGDRRQRDAFHATPNPERRHGGKEASKKDETSVLEHENFTRIVHKLLTPIARHIPRARANETGAEQQEKEVGREVRAKPRPLGAASKKRERREKAERDADPVPPDRERAQLDENRMHLLSLAWIFHTPKMKCAGASWKIDEVK